MSLLLFSLWTHTCITGRTCFFCTLLIWVLKKCSVVVFCVQGRPGPKGDAGDSGLPGQKVSTALAERDFRGFKQETGIIHRLTTSLASGRTRMVFQLGRIESEDGEFMNITFKLNFCRDQAKKKSPWLTVLVKCWPAFSCCILLFM